MTVPQITLEDMLTSDEGRVYLTGLQALVRLLMMQRRRDLKAGLNTAGFVSGYRGSPLGGLDLGLWRTREQLNAHHIRFQPAVNEELAATAVIGTQLVSLSPDADYDGVFAMWYGKGPGLDRAGDAMKHLNALGSSPHGGILVVVGDDHGAVSSSLAHQSEQVMASWLMPVLHPASVQEYLDFGLLGFAMSRFSGCAVGFKALSETVESAVAVDVHPDRPAITIPGDFSIPPQGLNIITPELQLEQEERLHLYKLPAAIAFARANGIDRHVIGDEHPRHGIVVVGKAYLDLIQALRDLGIDEQRARSLGLGVYKVGMPWPLEPEGARAFARGVEDILVIEEKRPVIEGQLKDLLYGLADGQRPRIVGKADEQGAPLLPAHGEINSGMIARILATRLGLDQGDGPVQDYLEFLDRGERAGREPAVAVRPPYFCSGCPHNTSTRLPEGSLALAGTGCHLMAAFMDRETGVFLHMGCEGAAWLGMAPFTRSRHMFQNLGDGTYAHSGSLAIRQALASDANITYKILYNDAVAMTGGQPVEGGITVPELSQQLYHEGVREIAVVTDEAGKYPRDAGFAPGVTVHHRRELDHVQRRFRDLPGVSVIIYDQTCAAELRRRRKRGELPDPPKRAFINELVCEGCGDCNVKSNCLSIEPLETEFGRKRVINQSSCNKDFSCIEGFCPSFVTVHGGRIRTTAGQEGERPAPPGGLPQPPEGLPQPDLPDLGQPYGILVAGIGGTGVVTIGQILGMAAYLDGRGVTVLDFAGLAQKGGGVLTHVRISSSPEKSHPARIPMGGANLLLAGDAVVSVGREALMTLRKGTTRAIVNSKVLPTAATVLDPDAPVDIGAHFDAITRAVGRARVKFINAADASERLIGDAIGGNILMLGYAFQRGAIPLSLEAIERAIELNGVAVAENLRAFAWGRMAAHSPDALEAATGALDDGLAEEPPTLDELIDRRAHDLVEYQSPAYARRYRELVDAVREAEDRLGRGASQLAETVARNFHKLMAYKDEYEVARLYSDGRFEQKLRRQFEGDYTLKFHLAPPLVARRDPNTGHLLKSAYGAWLSPAFRSLAKLKRLRGTPFDIFGYSAERRMERRLIVEYEATMAEILTALTIENHALAVDIATLPDGIRGFGHVKQANAALARQRHAALMSAFRGAPDEAAAAAE